MEHEASRFQLVMSYFKVRACMQKLAFLNEIPTWENQTFNVWNQEREDELYKYHPMFLAKGHHSYDSFRIFEGTWLLCQPFNSYKVLTSFLAWRSLF
jgi:hypothetical protein